MSTHESLEKDLARDFRRGKRVPVTIDVEGHRFTFTVGSIREFHEADDLAMEIYFFMQEMETQGDVPNFRLLRADSIGGEQA